MGRSVLLNARKRKQPGVLSSTVTHTKIVLVGLSEDAAFKWKH